MASWSWYTDPIPHGKWTMRVGQIGCIVINPDYAYYNGPIIGWQIHWHEQCDYVVSEGIRLEPEVHQFPFTSEGLEQAKQAGIDFARQLVSEALEHVAVINSS